ncbi:MAG: hypothetical protein ACLFUB_13310 [Cyclobacteriaceae bacterium]
MKTLITRSFVAITLFVWMASCGDISQKMDEKLDAINRTAEGIDSLANTKLDKLQQLDTLVNGKLQKVERLDSIFNQTRSRLDSLQITN